MKTSSSAGDCEGIFILPNLLGALVEMSLEIREVLDFLSFVKSKSVLIKAWFIPGLTSVQSEAGDIPCVQ